MTVIDIGAGATDRAGLGLSVASTYLDLTNPANDSGVLTSMEMWFIDTGFPTTAAGVKCGTLYYVSSLVYAVRDYETIGTVTKGSKKTFTGLNCSVTSGDFLGYYSDTGSIEYATSGGSGVYGIARDAFTSPPEGSNWWAAANYNLSIYATGVTSATLIKSVPRMARIMVMSP